jgi:hypothetical protein
MNAKTLIDIHKPATQTVSAVCALLAWKGRSSNPLPQFVELGSGEARVVLVLSNKKDAYYTVTGKDCSCPARSWHPNGPCKHQRKYFPEDMLATTAKPAAIKQPNHGAWHGHNGPVLDEVRPAKVSSPLSVIDCHDTTARDVAYHSIKADRDLWPCEA